MEKMKSENPAVEAVTDNEAAVSREGAAFTDSDASAAANPDEELVELFVERDSSDENPNLLICVNGKNFLMPRGQTSTVPKYVTDEYERSRQAQYKADRTIAGMKGIKRAN